MMFTVEMVVYDYEGNDELFLQVEHAINHVFRNTYNVHGCRIIEMHKTYAVFHLTADWIDFPGYNVIAVLKAIVHKIDRMNVGKEEAYEIEHNFLNI